MKNDIRKADEITVEMRVNDIVYGIISDELDDMICDCEDLSEEFEKLYFAKHVLSVLENSDMPILRRREYAGLTNKRKSLFLSVQDLSHTPTVVCRTTSAAPLKMKMI